MHSGPQTRRELLAGIVGAASLVAAPPALVRPAVSIVRIRNGRIEAAVEQAIELIGGIRFVARGKERVLLKPNLVSPVPRDTTKPVVVRALVRLLKAAGKDVSIGEGSAAAPPFNVKGSEIFRTTNVDLLNGLQQHVFHQLGYADLAKNEKIPLVNLHTGDLVDVPLPGAFVFDKLTIHRALAETDLLCSVPMMKTHTLAGVTLGMKNLIGAYPGSVYQAIRGRMHDAASKIEPSGTASAIIDIVRANKPGLVVVDASTAMEGEGPSNGTLIPMDLILAGTNPLATDMVAASVMSFEPSEIPTFTWANKAGLRPERLDEIDILGEPLDGVRRRFVRPHIVPWSIAGKFWATREIG